MRLEYVQVPVGVEISDGHSHPRLLLPVLAQRDAAVEAPFGERAVAIVMQQQARSGVAGDVDILPSVAVEVGRHGRQAITRLDARDAGFFAHVGERSVRVVAIQPADLLRQSRRAAVDRNAPVIAARVLPADRHFVLVEDVVMRNEKIQPAIAIVIDPGAARAIARSRMDQSGLFRHVRKSTVAVIVEQKVLTPAGDEDVVEAVVIVVAHGNAGSPHATPQPGFRGDIGKRAVAVILIQSDDCLVGRRLQAAAGQDHDVLPAIVVVIEEGHAASHGLDDVVVVVHGAVNHGRRKASRLGHVDEMRVEGQPRRLAARDGLDAARCHAAILLRADWGSQGKRPQRKRQQLSARHCFQDTPRLRFPQERLQSNFRNPWPCYPTLRQKGRGVRTHAIYDDRLACNYRKSYI